MARSKREIEIRTIEITTAFKLFLELYADDERYSIDIEKAAKNIVTKYFGIVDGDGGPKELVRENIDNSKIASITEILIMKSLPLSIQDGTEQEIRSENANLAFYVASLFMIGVRAPNEKAHLDVHMESEIAITKYNEIVEDHITLMEAMDINAGAAPIYLNASFWKLLDLVAQMLPGHSYYSLS